MTDHHAERAIAKLREDMETLGRVVAAQNESTATLRREWEMFAQSIERRTTREGIDAAKMLTWLSTG